MTALIIMAGVAVFFGGVLVSAIALVAGAVKRHGKDDRA